MDRHKYVCTYVYWSDDFDLRKILVTQDLTGRNDWWIHRSTFFDLGTSWRADLDDVEKRKFFTLQGLELRPLGHLARSQSLYRLSYPGSYNIVYTESLPTFQRNILSASSGYKFFFTLKRERAMPKSDRVRPKRYASIYGGSRVIAREFPHMVSRILWLCGGTLIHKRFVLTAAHCLEDSSIYRYGKARYVRLGDVDLKSSADDVTVQAFNVVRRIPHPYYRTHQKYHDIALLELDDDVYFDSFVRPACLHTRYTVPSEMPIASGWGRTEPGRNLTGQKLMKVDLEFQPLGKCMDVITEQVDPWAINKELSVGLLNDSMLCVGVLEGGKDSCQGDSGGPLQVRAQSAVCDFDVVGIVSFGIDCAKPVGHPCSLHAGVEVRALDRECGVCLRRRILNQSFCY
ncbi:hypothetical protein B7P43_G11987 [Cryptotermes secundus]|uniref:Peptidase S1 domain-containing protein n=1 Tax=Cryptotermes secundus TaxID=105785 RepID=A0A2J7R9V8_9NEOP|nr:hypothetical protein B7P43_G11987 [Cryptotermes secundus]